MTRGLGVLVSGLSGLLGAAGCVADGGGEAIVILKNVHAGAGCSLNATEAEAGIAHGSLDLLLPSGYLVIAQLKSQITAVTGEEALRTITATGARVDITFPGSALFGDAELAELRTAGLTHFRQLFTAPIVPNGGITDVGFDLIPRALADRVIAKADLTQMFRLEAEAAFTVEGDLAGDPVASQRFTFPVTLGNNVSVNVPGACDLPRAFGTPRTGYACNPAQDEPIDCCSRAGALVCPATIAPL